MKKIDYNLIIKSIIFLIITIILKFSYIPSLTDNNNYYNMLIFWGNNSIANLIWLLPIIFLNYQLTKKFVYKAINFNTRYVNRNHYINHLLMINFIYCLFLSIFFSLIQILIFIKFNNLNLSYNIFSCIITYFWINYLLNLCVIFLSLLIRKYIYSVVIIILLFCLILITLNLLKLYIICLISIVLCTFMNYAIRKKYFMIDLGGVLK